MKKIFNPLFQFFPLVFKGGGKVGEGLVSHPTLVLPFSATTKAPACQLSGRDPSTKFGGEEARGGKLEPGIFIFLTAFFSPRLIFACPMCSDLLERGKDAFAAMRFGQGIAWSMILMFAVPFVLVGALAFLIWRAEQRRKNQLKGSLQ